MFVYFSVIVFILGAAMGSFLNCLAWRLYKGEGLWGRSHCPACNAKIHWYDNAPLFSFLNLGGRCRNCRKKISWQYFIMEAVVGLLFLAVFLYRINFDVLRLDQLIFAVNFDWLFFLTLLKDWVLISALSVIFLMDFKWYVVSDEVCLVAAGLMTVINFALGMAWQSLAVGALVGAGFFAAQYVVSKGAWVGGGDIRIGLLAGLALGWPGIAICLLLSYVAGAVWGLGLVASGKMRLDWKRLSKFEPPSDKEIAAAALPFGTFLSLAALVTVYWGERLLNWYLNLY